MTEAELKAAWDSIPADQAEEILRTGTRIGAEIRQLRDQCRADATRASEFDKPWVLVDRLGIPRRNLDAVMEERLRQSFQRAASDGTCSSCEIIVLAVVLAFFAAMLILIAAMIVQLVPPVIAALVAGGFALTAGAGLAIALAMTDQFAGAVGRPVCVSLGYCT